MNLNTFDILNSYLIKTKTDEIEHSPISVNRYVESILKFLIKIKQPKTILELGTLYGKSAISMAQASKKTMIHSIENNKTHYDIALKNISRFQLESQINLHLGDCSEILNQDQIKNLKPELIFIDANKANYLKYLDWSVKYGSKDCFIVIDNIFIHRVQEKFSDPTNKIHQTIEALLLEIQDESKFNTLIIPYERDALAVVQSLL
jgi:predicted O-methyltransferase YrrM